MKGKGFSHQKTFPAWSSFIRFVMFAELVCTVEVLQTESYVLANVPTVAS